MTFHDIENIQTDGSILHQASIAFGVFDGVHRGHNFLINQACKSAYKDKSACVVVTFDKDPDELFGTKTFTKLMTNEDRIAYLSTLPVDAVCVLPFTKEFSTLLPNEFLKAVFMPHTPRHIHVGADFKFGYRAQGTVDDMRIWANMSNTFIHPHTLLVWQGKPISATRIRSLLLTGDVEGAREALGHPYQFSGEVIAGRGEGKEFGIRTANIRLAPELQALREGVYASWVFFEGSAYKAAVNIGYAASFENAAANCEIHIIDFSFDIYGKTLTVQPELFLRDQRIFKNNEELISVITQDIATTKEALVRP
ncbi:MAG: riboflavin biosynthesis protein RibF [Eggerthellaceae bacterium]|nr:riboflavin biosynthesis protein RibF [Eggerthellaceae bacterium]